jgi:hypothetical protein
MRQVIHITDESDVLTLHDVKLGDHTLTARLANRDGHLVLALGTGSGPARKEVWIHVDRDGRVNFAQVLPDGTHYLQTDETGKLLFLPGKPYKIMGRTPFWVETGLEVLLGDEGGTP